MNELPLELFDHVLLYLDVSLVPEVIARVIKKWIDKEELVLAGIQIIGTIAQSMV